jgi:CheY-like chemotaxis protein
MASDAATHKTPTVLVLDDEPSVRKLGRQFLSTWGYGCVEAESIEQALEMLRTTSVIAAILDVRLPGQHTGLDLLATLRQRPEFSDIPVLIMTGGVLTAEEEGEITKKRGYLFYKPEGFSAIVDFLDQLTGRDRSH